MAIDFTFPPDIGELRLKVRKFVAEVVPCRVIRSVSVIVGYAPPDVRHRPGPGALGIAARRLG